MIDSIDIRMVDLHSSINFSKHMCQMMVRSKITWQSLVQDVFKDVLKKYAQNKFVEKVFDQH